MEKIPTIEEVTKAFNMVMNSDASFSLFNNLADLANKKAEEPMDNDSYWDALMLTRYMFLKTNHSLCMVTGHEAEVSFLDTLSTTFRDTLIRIRESHGKAFIIFIAKSIPQSIRSTFREFLQDNTLKCVAVTLTDPKLLTHFITCDDKMVRIEEYHEPLELSSRADTVKAKMYFNNPARTKMSQDFFNSLWGHIQTKLEDKK